MKRKIVALILAVFMISTSCVGYSEKEYNSSWKIVVGAEYITVSGDTPALGGMPFALMVTPKNVAVTVENCVYYNQGATDNYGLFTWNIPKVLFTTTNQYIITVVPVSGDQISLPYYEASNQEVADALASVNLNASEIVNCATTLNINLTDYEALEELSKQEVLNELSEKNYASQGALAEEFYRLVSEKYSLSHAIYVSAELGDDLNGDGSSEKPFQSITRAKNQLKLMRISGDIHSDITVYIQEGVYCESEGLVFDEADNLPGAYKTTYAAFDDDNVIISGSVPVTEWTEYENGKYYANVGMGKKIDVIYQNGDMLTKARYPNEGADMLDGYLRSISLGTRTRNSFGFKTNDFPRPSSFRDLEVLIWPGSGNIMWYAHTLPVESINYSQNMITLASESSTYLINSGVTEGEEGNRYFLQGDLAFLDQEGEFYYDSDIGRLYVMPVGGSIQGVEISIPAHQNGVTFKGSSPETPVKNIELKGITIRNTERTANVQRGEGVGDTGNGIYIENAENIVVKDSKIHDVGGHGVNIVGNVNDCTVYGNEIYNVGVSGVSFNSDSRIGDTLTYVALEPICENNLICNNYVHNGSLLVPHGYGIAYQHSGARDNMVSHNKIEYFKRSGLRAEYAAYTNYMEFNEIAHVNTGSEDTGVIYASLNAVHVAEDGVTVTEYLNKGTVIRNNYIHTSPVMYGGGAVVYFDDFAHGCIAENNIIEAVQTETSLDGGKLNAAFLIKADNNIVRNNYVVNNTALDWNVASHEQNGSTANDQIIEKNIFYNSGQTAYYLASVSESRLSSVDYNMFYTYDVDSGSIIEPKVLIGTQEKTFAAWKNSEFAQGMSFDEHSLTDTNPLFVDVANGDLRLKEASKAYDLGVVDIDMQSIGLKADFKYAEANDVPEKLFVRSVGREENNSYLQLGLGENVTLETLLRGQNGFVLNGAEINYESNNKEIATVSENGVVTSVGPGIATIRVQAQYGESLCVTSIDIYSGSPEITISDISYTNDASFNFKGILTGRGEKKTYFTPIYATYDVAGNFSHATLGEQLGLAEGETHEVTYNCEKLNGKFRLYLWEMEELRPVVVPVTITEQSEALDKE